MTMLSGEPEELVLKVGAGIISGHDALLILKRMGKKAEKTPEMAERFRKVREDICSAAALRCTKEGDCSIFVKRTRRIAAGQPPARGSRIRG